MELGKFTVNFDELNTPLEKICYFLKKTDKLTMPLEEVVVYANKGGPMGKALAEAMDNMIDYSVSGWPHDYQKQLDYIEKYIKDNMADLIEERVKEDVEAITADIMMRSETKGIIKGREEGREEGKELAQKDMAQKLVSRGFKPKDIAQLMGLSLDEVKTFISAHESDNA